MLNGFQPIMKPDQVQLTANYYNHVFVPLGKVTPMMSAKKLAKLQAYLGASRACKPTRRSSFRCSPRRCT